MEIEMVKRLAQEKWNLDLGWAKKLEQKEARRLLLRVLASGEWKKEFTFENDVLLLYAENPNSDESVLFAVTKELTIVAWCWGWP